MTFKSNMNPMFRSKFSEDIFNLKYAHTGCDSWEQLARVLVEDVCGNLRPDEEPLMKKEERRELQRYIKDLKFVPGVGIFTMQVEREDFITTASY